MPKFLILAAAVALVAAACGSATDAEPAAPATTQAPVTSTTAIVADDDHAEGEGESDDGHDNGGSAETPDRTVEVLMTEFSFDVDPFGVVAGETIEFVVTNTGVVPHELRVSNQERVDEHLDAGHDDHEDSDAAPDSEHEEVADYVLVLDAGDTASIVVTFPEDQALFTNVVCLLPGHYEAGMAADVEYTA